MLERIPEELRILNQWVCATKSDIKDYDKVPINPLFGTKASPTNPNHWTSFDNALQKRTEEWPHVSFVLTESDPYTIIDLDDPYNPKYDWSDEKRDALAKVNEMIMDSFESYTEISQSGTGIHIIVRAKIPKGVRRDTVELYSNQRHMICTGNVYKDLPIVDLQERIDALFTEMTKNDLKIDTLIEVEETISDEDLIEMAMNAVNGEKFTSLCNGDLTGYPSQSEADLALMAILGYYSKSNTQCHRIFRMTQLGKRDKAVKNDTYLNYTLKLVRSKLPSEVDFEDIKERTKGLLTPTPKEKVISSDLPTSKLVDLTRAQEIVQDDLFPPGLVGEIAEYIFESSARPVKEISLMAAIGLTAGLVGRQYNISNVGLNQYLILLAKTGSGKEDIPNGIDRIAYAVRKSVPMFDDFRGPGAFASGPALVKQMSKKRCFVSILGEFGFTLQEICDPRAIGANKTLKQALLDLYQKSGWNSMLRSSVYSDKEKDTDDVHAPALTILGESTPESFFEGLSEAHIVSGLIPRLTVLEYTGDRVYLNPKNGFKPSDELVGKIVDLATIVLTMQSNDTHVDVILDSQAKVLADKFEVETTDLINTSTNAILSMLWNRAHLKVLKLAALIATGVNYNHPVITSDIFIWALNFVKQDIQTIYARFEKGEVGTGESKQEADVIRRINEYFTKVPKCDLKKFHEVGAIPASWLRDNVKQLASFRSDPRGASKALKVVVEDMVNDGLLQEIPKPQCEAKFRTTGKVYVLGERWNK